jgi:hypothetical protein
MTNPMLQISNYGTILKWYRMRQGIMSAFPFPVTLNSALSLWKIEQLCFDDYTLFL